LTSALAHKNLYKEKGEKPKNDFDFNNRTCQRTTTRNLAFLAVKRKKKNDFALDEWSFKRTTTRNISGASREPHCQKRKRKKKTSTHLANLWSIHLENSSSDSENGGRQLESYSGVARYNVESLSFCLPGLVMKSVLAASKMLAASIFSKLNMPNWTVSRQACFLDSWVINDGGIGSHRLPH
jgi:hypothetical protein